MNNIVEKFAGFNIPATMWIWFIPVAALTFFFSLKMVKYAEVVIEKTKFGGAFVGGALVSVATSLTELVTEITQGVNGTPAVGLSDDLGANLFSTTMIAVVMLIFMKQMFTKKLDKWTVMSILISMTMTIFLTIVIWFGEDLHIGKGGKIVIGLIPFFFLLAYVGYVAISYKFGTEDEVQNTEPTNISAKKGVLGFLLFSALLLVAALGLNLTIDAMMETYGLSPKSAGGIFLSMTTAMPEIVSLVVLIRAKQPIAAVASIIGSHVFNISLIFWGDIAFHTAPILTGPGVHGLHGVWILGALTAIELALLALFVIIAKKIKKKWVYAIIPTLIILTYIIGWIIMLTVLR
ncbi:sodium:calcium antiporter [Mycoplasma todarodis]|uniref:sodium:calcium antiporter n=1 Tax=Mycoplasma todarodis TaxID=1937191 RepID=UPI003B379B09